MSSSSIFVLSLLSNIKDTLIGSPFNDVQLEIVLGLVESHFGFEDLRNLYLSPLMTIIGRDKFLPAIRNQPIIPIGPDMTIEELEWLFGFPGGQGWDPEYTFVLGAQGNYNIQDFSGLFVSRFEVINAPIQFFTYPNSLVTRMKLNHSRLGGDAIKILNGFPNLEQLSLLHDSLSLKDCQPVRFSLTRFSMVCSLFSYFPANLFCNLSAFSVFISRSAETLTELVLIRNAYRTWEHRQFFTDYIALFCRLGQFPRLEYLAMDVSSDMFELAFLPRFLELCPRLRVIKLYMDSPRLRPIEFICDSILSKESIACFKLQIFRKPTPVVFAFMDNLKLVDSRFEYVRDYGCKRCEREMLAWGV